jgi:hypothetical protein
VLEYKSRNKIKCIPFGSGRFGHSVEELFSVLYDGKR